MSSIQDRIRRLQSADAPSPPTPPLTSQTSLPTPPTAPKQTASNVSHRAAKFQPPPFNHTSTSSSTTRDINPLNRRVEALQAGVNAGKLQDRVNRIQHATNNTHVGGLVDGKMAIFESRAGETGVVERTVGTLERVGQDKAGAKGAWNEAGAVVAKLGVFEKEESGKGSGALLGKKAMFEAAGGGVEKPALLKKASLFGAAPEEQGDVLGDAAREKGLLNKAARFEAEGDGGGEGTGEEKQDKQLLKRAAIFEQGAPEIEHKVKEDKAEPPVEVEEEKRLLQRAAMFEAKGSRESEVQVERKESGLLKRAALFEKVEGAGKKVDDTEKHGSEVGVWKKAEAKAEAKVEQGGKNAQVTEEKSLVDELREVKVINEALVGRLIELSGAFRRLEKNREEMQERLKKLEQSHVV
eukprot:GFKZ01009385.1.p1 GENE.GFKZ01009385.1~~GFKZ01009385.1.p1  ORF type:complete len:434 (-),score=112.38 GFKZ01009385.1:288-1517(-)